MIKYLHQKKKEEKFLYEGFDLSFAFTSFSIKKIKFRFFEEIFNKYEFSDLNIKIINKKYIENCNKRYAN